jgi:hypothetical protein
MDKLNESYNKIKNEYRTIEKQEIEQKKSTLPEETKKKLAENNIDEDEYIKFTISRDKIYEQ